MRIKKHILAIDPGDNTAYAFFDKRGTGDPILVGTLRCPKQIKKLGHINEISYLSKEFRILLSKTKPDYCIIEGVTIWSGSVKSITSASRGNLIKLAYLIGAYIRVCATKNISVQIVTPQEWKGQMSKDVVARRIKRALGRSFSSSHETDAVGIGLHILGKL